MTFFDHFFNVIQPLLLPGYLLLEMVAIFFALEVIFKSRTPEGAIGWAVGLVFMPLIVLPLYMLFGERYFYGYVEARRQGDQEIHKNAQAIIADMTNRFGVTAERNSRYQLLETLALMPFTRGNGVNLYADGEQAYAKMFEAIDRATRYVLVQFYIVRDDAIGKALAEHLMEKARQGVQIYFLYDQVGSFGLSRGYIKKLQQAGVDIRGFRSFRWNIKGRLQINFRNHRKILLIDGQEAFVGGLNIGDEYRHRHARLTPWRDTQIHLQGPAVSGVQMAFVEDWYWLTSHMLALNWSPEPAEPGCDVLALPTGPADYQDTCQLMFINAINRAKQRIWIVSPYFVPDEAITKALKLASYRGVDVRVLLPGIVDSRFVQLSSFDFVDVLRHTKVKFYQYQQGFLHQKVMLLDNQTAYIGTANLDNRSFRLNFELTIVVVNAAFGQQVEAMLQHDFDNAKPLDTMFVQQSGIGFRAMVKIARLFAPIQ